MARKFGLSRSATNRHAHLHVTARLKRAAEARAAGADPGLLDKLADLNRLAREMLARAVNAGELAVAVSAIGEARKQLELEARLLGQLRESGTTVVNVNVTPEQATRIAQVYLQRRGLAAPAAIDTTAASQASPAFSEVPGATEPKAVDVHVVAPVPVSAPDPPEVAAAMERWARLHPELK